jgi:hypothetical protein
MTWSGHMSTNPISMRRRRISASPAGRENQSGFQIHVSLGLALVLVVLGSLADPALAGEPGPDALEDRFIKPGIQLMVFHSPSPDASPPPVPPLGEVIVPAALTVPSGCTGNWIWVDQVGRLLLGTAGHCLLRTGEDGGANATSGSRVFACRSRCVVGGILALEAKQIDDSLAPEGKLGATDWIELGPVAYARNRGKGTDFGLVEIPRALAHFVSPSWAPFTGPTAMSTNATYGELAATNGKGAIVGESIATMNRIGMFIGFDDKAFAAWLPVNVGDSGAPIAQVLLDASGTVVTILAAGIVTHKEISPADELSTAIPYVQVTGTTTVRAGIMAEESGICIRLVTQDEDAARTPPAANCIDARPQPCTKDAEHEKSKDKYC